MQVLDWTLLEEICLEVAVEQRGRGSNKHQKERGGGKVIDVTLSLERVDNS